MENGLAIGASLEEFRLKPRAFVEERDGSLKLLTEVHFLLCDCHHTLRKSPNLVLQNRAAIGLINTGKEDWVVDQMLSRPTGSFASSESADYW